MGRTVFPRIHSAFESPPPLNPVLYPINSANFYTIKAFSSAFSCKRMLFFYPSASFFTYQFFVKKDGNITFIFCCDITFRME
jgi:hypothetical protein